MSTHSLEFLYPTDPPGPRALRLVILLVVAATLVGAVVWTTDPVRNPVLPEAAPTGLTARNP